MSFAELSKQVNPKPFDMKLIQKRPSFYNGELYRILVTYDRQATKGLTIEDMVEAISAKYGPATRPDVKISFPTNELYNSTEKVIARWEDSQYSYNLFRSTVLNTFGLVMFSKQLDAEVRSAVAASLNREGEEGRQRESERQKKEAGKLEVARERNRKTFRP